jgi:transcriptional regulator with XRE-family HTH domain
MTSVGEKLKQRRQSLNLTQQLVADELGVTVTTLDIQLLADILNVSVISKEFMV